MKWPDLKVNTEETRYNKILGTTIFFLLHQISCYSVVNKQYKAKEIISLGAKKTVSLYSDISFIEFPCITYFCFANVNILLSILFLHQNFQEFYNLTVDPNQLTNIVGKLDPKFVTAQNEKLILLSMCKGPSCRQVFPPPKTWPQAC